MKRDDIRHALLSILRDINDVQRRVATLWEALGTEGIEGLEPPTCAECNDVVVDRPGDRCINCVRAIHDAGRVVARHVEGELFARFDAGMEKVSIDTYPRKETA